MFSIFLIGLASAVNDCGNDNSYLGTFSRGENITLKQPCDSCAFVNLSSISYPNSTVQNFNIAMTQNGVEYTTLFTNADDFGCYSYSVLGDKGGVNAQETIDFRIGENLIGLIVILLLFVIGLIFSIGGLIKGSTLVWKLLFSSLSYFLLLGVVFISSRLSDNLNIPVASSVLSISLIILIAGVLPFILLLLAYLLYQIVNEKRMKRMMDMGHTRESAERRLHKK